MCRSNQNKQKTNKFEQVWTGHEDHYKIVQQAWSQANGNLTRKLDTTLKGLSYWGHKQFGVVPKRIKEVQNELQVLNQKSEEVNMIAQIQIKEKELDTLLESGEIWWSQRSRVLWLQQGDKNTKFFHQKASQRRKRNRIDVIQDKQGNTQSEFDNIERVLIQHFQELFTRQDTHDIAKVVEVVKGRINADMRDHLSTIFTQEEVMTAIKGMKGLAAPGPDGLPASFYHNYWEIVGKEVTEAALEVLNNGGDPSQYNSTHICLIPKIKSPIGPNDYRPISLCNVILKIITKTIANRIKVILPRIISHNQSAFIQDRLITGNTLIAFELFHYMKNTNRKNGYVGIKTDMAKAYDRVEWDFLQATLESMGFPNQLISTIIKCVSTVQFSILINGSPSLPFKPQRGLRQGDPLSPYLFIICADVFSGLIEKAQGDKLLHGVKIVPTAPEITHLLFADDSLLFCRANKVEIHNLNNIISSYQKASGQLVNMAKSETMFSKRVPEDTRREINQIMTMQRVDYFSKYLGMPTQLGRSKQDVFNFILDKIWKKLKGWKEKNLSFAGRSTLIKAVIQGIPTYVMSCFMLPKGLCHQIERLACNFWWGSITERNKIHWISWKKLCNNKTKGGLGFRDTWAFNEALLAK
jgi:hypothetical protein